MRTIHVVFVVAAFAAAAALFIGAAAAHPPDPTRLPLGDTRLAKEPKAGWIWPCRVNPEAGGAHAQGPWIRADGTYDLTAKIVVGGAVTWPHQFEIFIEGAQRIVAWNDLPNHPTGIYPIRPSDPAYRYDRNPNSIRVQQMRIALPADPQLAPQPSCAPGAVGVLLSGVVLFNALDAPGRDAVAHETQDACQGHPQPGGVYHYHNVSKCLLDADPGPGPSKLMGYAIDGFGIYGPRDEQGRELSSADLDECHGRIGEVMWDGRKRRMYHYVATPDFPYTIGCLRGHYDRAVVRMLSGPPPGPMSNGPMPHGPPGHMGGPAPPGHFGGPGFGPPPR